jgi:hypothetical protein
MNICIQNVLNCKFVKFVVITGITKEIGHISFHQKYLCAIYLSSHHYSMSSSSGPSIKHALCTVEGSGNLHNACVSFLSFMCTCLMDDLHLP